MIGRGKVVRQYAIGAVTGAVITQAIVVPGRARLVSVDWSLALFPSGDDDANAQLSFRSELVTQGPGAVLLEPQIISDVQMAVVEVTAAGISFPNIVKQHKVDVPVEAQQRIYLHLSAGTGTLAVSVGLSYVRE